jgi:hypothetical protein
MDKHEKIINIIKAIRESFGASIAVYTLGNCYQFFEILKTLFEDAEAYYDGNHVWVKIGDKFYDIRGEKVFTIMPNLNLIKDQDLINSLSRNKYPDEKRKKEREERIKIYEGKTTL